MRAEFTQKISCKLIEINYLRAYIQLNLQSIPLMPKNKILLALLIYILKCLTAYYPISIGII